MAAIIGSQASERQFNPSQQMQWFVLESWFAGVPYSIMLWRLMLDFSPEWGTLLQAKTLWASLEAHDGGGEA